MRTGYCKGEAKTFGTEVRVGEYHGFLCECSFDDNKIFEAMNLANAEQVMIRWNAFEPLMHIAEQIAENDCETESERGELFGRLIQQAIAAVRKGHGLS